MRRLVVTAGLNKLFNHKWFDICQLDKVMEIIGTSSNSEAYRLLRALHCVDFAEMNSDLRAQLPQLVNECLRHTPVIECQATAAALDGVPI